MINATDLKRKAVILIDGQPYQVLDIFLATPSARGASTMAKIKVRSLLNSSVHDKTFRSSEKFEEADIEITTANFLYKSGQEYYFMDQATFETFPISEDAVTDSAGFLCEQLEVRITRYKDSPVSIELPLYVNLKVAEADPGSMHAGSAGSGTKNVKLETGLVLRVPSHISAGETVRVNTATGEFSGRSQSTE